MDLKSLSLELQPTCHNRIPSGIESANDGPGNTGTPPKSLEWPFITVNPEDECQWTRVSENILKRLSLARLSEAQLRSTSIAFGRQEVARLRGNVTALRTRLTPLLSPAVQRRWRQVDLQNALLDTQVPVAESGEVVNSRHQLTGRPTTILLYVVRFKEKGRGHDAAIFPP